MNIIIAGIQGSGKGTQSALLAETFNLKHISTGDVLRRHITDKTEFGIKYEEENAKGNLAPDEILFDIVEYETKNLDGKSGYILDGFPRTQAQADWTTETLDVDYVILLDIPEQVATERLKRRGRVDDTVEAITNRIATYKAQTLPAIDSLGIDIKFECNGYAPDQLAAQLTHDILGLPYPKMDSIWIGAMALSVIRISAIGAFFAACLYSVIK